MDENTAPAPEIGAAPTADPAAPAGQPEFKIPDGQELLTRDEVTRLRRAEERAKGMQSFYETAQKAGFKDATAFEKHQQTMAALSQKGLSLDALMAAMTSDVSDTGQGGDGAAFDPAELERSIMEKIETQHAEKEHMTAEQAELQLLADLSGLELPANAPPEVADLFKAAAEGLYWRNRSPYGEEHRLKGRLAPIGGKEAVAEKIHGPLKKALSSLSGLSLAEIGAAAARKKVSPAAGAAGAGDGTRSNEPEAATLEDAIRQKFKS